MTFRGEGVPRPREQAWNKEALPSQDVRDYFTESALRKMAEEMDPDISHDWNMVQEVSTTRDEKGATALGLQKTADGYAVYCVLRTRGEAPVSVELAEQSVGAFQLARHYSQLAATALPAELHHAFMKRLPDVLRATSGETLEERSVALAKAFFDVVPKTIAEAPDVTVPLKAHDDGGPTAQQQKDIAELLTLVGTVVPDAQERIEKFLGDIPYTMNAFTSYYRWLVSEIPKLAVDNNPAYPPHYDRRSIGDRIVHYNIAPLVTRHPKTQEEFTALLAGEPFVEAPPYHGTGGTMPAFVHVDEIVGVFNASSWQGIHTAENRGVPRIMELARRMENGVPDKDPIILSRIDGKYYVTGDGRHRVAAMKALGVHNTIPVMVSDATRA